MAAIFGLLLILAGILIIWVPVLLQYVIGGMFILLGLGAVVLGMKMNSSVTYRRIDADREPPE